VTVAATFAEHAATIQAALRSLVPAVERAAASMSACLAGDGTVLACGNGGSAADAQHLVAELVGRFRGDRRALSATTLCASAPTLTAIANDYGFEQVFARQVEALARPGDVLVAISTSGNSANVIAAAAAARARRVTVIGLTGAGGGRLAPLVDHLLEAPSDVVARIQEVHSLCIHALCEAIDADLAAEASP
jgi:D-sedoheptulose 7-phosphate isomerase